MTKADGSTNHVDSTILNFLPVFERVLRKSISDVSSDLRLILRKLKEFGGDRGDSVSNHCLIVRENLQPVESEQDRQSHP